ncbi:hypothetical protein BGZ65_007119, partial [Modicella reniformis]
TSSYPKAIKTIRLPLPVDSLDVHEHRLAVASGETYWVFDLRNLDSFSIRRSPLERRLRVLKLMPTESGYTEHLSDGADTAWDQFSKQKLRTVVPRNLENPVSALAYSPSGSRSDW